MNNIAARVKSIFGLRLFVVLFFLVLSWLTAYQIGFREMLENGPTAVVKESDQLLGLSVKAPEKTGHKSKEVEYEEISPDNLQKAIEYKMSFDPQLYDDYYNDFFLNQKIISVKNIRTYKEDYVFTGEERTGSPHWLGNNNLFFYTHCGTSCRGIYLVDTRDKETRFGGFSFSFEGGRWLTYFHDWFGKRFVFEGLLDDVKSEVVDGQAILILRMNNDVGNFMGEKRLLFKDDSLKLL